MGIIQVDTTLRYVTDIDSFDEDEGDAVIQLF